MILVKSQLTEKQVVYIVKTIFTIMEVSLLSPGKWQHQYLLRCNFTNASAQAYMSIIDENTDTSRTHYKKVIYIVLSS